LTSRLRGGDAGGLIAAIPAGALAGLAAVVGAETTPVVPVAAAAVTGVGVVSVLRPVWAIYAAVLLIPLESASASFGEGFGLTPTEFVVVCAAVGWTFQRVARRGGESLRSPLTLPLLVLVACHIPGLFLAADPFVVLKEFVMWSLIFVLYLAVLADDRPGGPVRLAAVIATAGALVAGIAVAKSAGSDQVALNFGGIVTDRATGSFESPVLLAIFVTICVPLQLVFALRARSSIARLAGWLGAAVSISALSLALTRGAFVALAIAGIWLVVVWRPARTMALVLAIVLTGLLLTKFNPLSSLLNTDLVVERIATVTSPETQTVEERLRIWRKTPQIFEDHLPFGIGAENLPQHAGAYGLLFPAGAPNNAHDTVLVIATEFGIPGLITLAWLGAALMRTLKRARAIRLEPERSLAIAISASFLALAVDALTDYSYGDNAFFLVVILLAAIASRLARNAEVPAPVHAPLTAQERKLALA
jgi:hypothetical protein